MVAMDKKQPTGWTCVVAMSLIVCTALSSAVAGAAVQQDSWFNIRTVDGYMIQEKITLTGTEEDIMLADGQTRVVYDYEKGFMTLRLNDDGVDICFVSSFERHGLESPDSQQVTDEMTGEDNDQFSVTNYYVDTTSEFDPAILSQRSRDMCSQLTVHWMTEKPQTATGEGHGRQRRACKRVCSAYCSCCPRDCGVRCSMKCSF